MGSASGNRPRRPGSTRRSGAASVLIVAPPDDPHATAVTRELDRLGTPWTALDLATLPGGGSITLSFGRARAPGLALRAGDRSSVASGGVGAVWWRRPHPVVVEGVADARLRRFAEREWRDATLGLWRGLDAAWVNEPVAADLAAVKPWQLTVAREFGLAIPRTLVTSDAAAARAFLAREPRAVWKTLHSEPGLWQPTRRVGARERRALSGIGRVPVVLQEHIPGVDERVTVVGNRVFPVEIDARKSRDPDDCRVDVDGCEIRPCSIPAPLARRLLAMTRRLGLAFAAFDLRRRPGGGHVFLEVNPAGQWLGFELRSGQPITTALAGLLTSSARAPGVAALAATRGHERARSSLHSRGLSSHGPGRPARLG